MKVSKLLVCLGAASMGCLVAGCGSGTPATYPVKGKVTFRGQPTEGVIVTLIPTTKNTDWTAYPRGTVGKDGSFQLKTFADNDGAPAGEYKVTLRWPSKSKSKPKTIQEFDEQVGGSPPDRFKGKFASPENSPWTVKIEAGDNMLEPIEVSVPQSR